MIQDADAIGEQLIAEFTQAVQATAPNKTAPLEALAQMEADAKAVAVGAFHTWTRIRGLQIGLLSGLAAQANRSAVKS